MKSTKAKPKTKRKTEGKTPAHPARENRSCRRRHPQARRRNSGETRRSLPASHLRARAYESFPIADRHHSLGAVHRRAREPGHEITFQKYPTPETFAYANPSELEVQIRPTGFYRNKSKSIQGASKKIVEEFSGAVPRTMESFDATRRRAKNSERRPRHGLWRGRRRRGGHARAKAFRAARSHAEYGSKKNRTGPDAHYPQGEMDLVLASAYLARPTRLPGAKTAVHRMQPRADLLLEGQNDMIRPRVRPLQRAGQRRACPRR